VIDVCMDKASAACRLCFCVCTVNSSKGMDSSWLAVQLIHCFSPSQNMKVLVLLSVAALAAAAAKFEFLEEWEAWKEQHGKGYQSERDELERHLIWLSNKKYIDQHNANSDSFGFTLAMNHFADLVS